MKVNLGRKLRRARWILTRRAEELILLQRGQVVISSAEAAPRVNGVRDGSNSVFQLPVVTRRADGEFLDETRNLSPRHLFRNTVDCPRVLQRVEGDVEHKLRDLRYARAARPVVLQEPMPVLHISITITITDMCSTLVRRRRRLCCQDVLVCIGCSVVLARATLRGWHDARRENCGGSFGVDDKKEKKKETTQKVTKNSTIKQVPSRRPVPKHRPERRSAAQR